jgi:hypothetical protein
MKQSEFDQQVQDEISHRIRVADAKYREECRREEAAAIEAHEWYAGSSRALAANIRLTDAIAIRLQIEKGTR